MTTGVSSPSTTSADPRVGRPYWSPYLVGIGIGVLSWLVFAIVEKPLGISTSMSAASGWCAAPVMGSDAVAKNAYWAKHGPKWDYGMLFIVGTFAGALVSSLVSRTFRIESVPDVWRDRFGPSVAKRMLGAFVGGALILYGARMAGGCTSGHGISGTMQLAASSWVAALCFFAGGIAAAMLLYR